MALLYRSQCAEQTNGLRTRAGMERAVLCSDKKKNPHFRSLLFVVTLQALKPSLLNISNCRPAVTLCQGESRCFFVMSAVGPFSFQVSFRVEIQNSYGAREDKETIRVSSRHIRTRQDESVDGRRRGHGLSRNDHPYLWLLNSYMCCAYFFFFEAAETPCQLFLLPQR